VEGSDWRFSVVGLQSFVGCLVFPSRDRKGRSGVVVGFHYPSPLHVWLLLMSNVVYEANAHWQSHEVWFRVALLMLAALLLSVTEVGGLRLELPRGAC
jgi:hypothetical protein